MNSNSINRGRGNSLSKFLPEPKNRVMSTLSGAASFVSRLATGQPVSGQFDSLIATQMEVQQQLMLVSMQSNLSRTEHETKMSPVRNLRVA